MIRIIFFILAAHLVLTGSIGQADEIPTTPLVPPKGEALPIPRTPLAEAPAPAAQPVPPPPEEGKTAEKALEQTEEEKKKPAATVLEQVVGFGKGRLEFEITQTYSHFSSNQLFINGFSILPILVVGNVDVQRIRRDAFITNLAARYKVIEGLQVELRIPYQLMLSRISKATGIATGPANPADEQYNSTSGLGDISGSLSYHFLNETRRLPSVFAGLGFKARTGRDVFETEDQSTDPPTGTGFNSVLGTLSVIKTSDPAVLFSVLSYGYSLPRKDVVFRNPGPQAQGPALIDFTPGDSLSLGIGLAYALNFKITLSFQYQQAISFPTRIDGRKLPNSFANAVSLRIGGVWAVNKKTSIDLGISPGLSLDAPDFSVSLRLPWKF